jgi:hypothetical protein
LFLSTVFAATASAQDTKRVVVLELEGTGADAVRKHIVGALSKRSEVELVDPGEASATASTLGASLTSGDGFRRVGAELSVDAFVGGRVEKRGKKWRATLWVANAETGDVLYEEPWTRNNRAQLKAIRANFWEVMGPHILASNAPPKEAEPEPQPEAQPAAWGTEEESPEKAEDDEAPPPGGNPALILQAGPRLLSRSLSYDNDQLANLRSYEVGAAFEVALSVQWYPAAHARGDFLADFGLDLDLDYAVGLESEENGRKVSTTAYELAGGLIYRVPLDMFEPRFRVGYVKHVFEVDTAATTYLPAVDYSAVRLGVGTGIKIIDALSLDVALAYLIVLDAGEIASDAYFPDASVSAFEAQGGIAWYFGSAYGARLGVDFRRYSADLKPDAAVTQPGGQKLADSATDDYLRFTLSFIYRLRGDADEAQKGQ